ncbi:GNAT family N-acetyltransferase [Streptococcus didelphis]|uniref:GNAT family N-acetyltransferase n=1 Tax=Streptococcus didelphis TaxID=102886 RepID=UPI0027D1FF16|nr:GNAT family protein [Streptococcus didelphis]WMB29322.1 GNAT family N-acetyltransferase [Streptococcus didelphis]
MTKQTVTIEEAQVYDAKQVLELFHKVSRQTDFISETTEILAASEEDLGTFLANSSNSLADICLLLKIDHQVVGLLNIASEKSVDTCHIGELFIIEENYQGFGLGKELMAVALDWAGQTPQLLKLELQVQVRNLGAIHLYQTYGFEIEGSRKLGVKTKNGDYLDLYYMGKVLDE